VLAYTNLSNILLLSQSTPSFPGSGTESNPYQIRTKAHLEELADIVNNSPPYPADNWSKNKYFILMSDITDSVRVPIEIEMFEGNFDGNNHTIIFAISSNTANVGLFRQLEFGDVYNLIIDGYINNSDAGIVGTNFSINPVTNCINNLSIVNSTSYNGEGAGGIVYQNHSTISHCINNGSVSSKNYVGGINAINVKDIDNCINTGKITGLEFSIVGMNGVGGICGRHRGRNVSNCINLGDIKGINNIAGIVGNGVTFSATIINCINAGYIKGNKYVGGILGSTYTATIITNCVNVGVVEGDEDVGAIGIED
jgi:hypothetical protein